MAAPVMSDFEPDIRDSRFDWPVLAAGSLASAALSVGLATTLLYVSRTNTGPAVGPTAAILNDAFSALFGASLSAGDLDGDGIGDLIVGSPWLNRDSLIDVGDATILFGSLFADGFDLLGSEVWSDVVP